MRFYSYHIYIGAANIQNSPVMRPRKPGKRTAKGSAPYFPTIFASLRDNRQSTEPAEARGTAIPPDTLPQTPLCTTAPSRGIAGQTAQCGAQAIAAHCIGHRSAVHRPTHRAAFPRAAQHPSRSAPQRHTACLSPRPLPPPRPTGAAPVRAGSKGTEKIPGNALRHATGHPPGRFTYN